jgi:hypothetical protein
LTTELFGFKQKDRDTRWKQLVDGQAVPKLVDQAMRDALHGYWKRQVIPQQAILAPQAVTSTVHSFTPNRPPVVSHPQQVLEQERNRLPVVTAAAQKSNAGLEASIAFRLQQCNVIYNANRQEIEGIWANLGFKKNEPNWRKVAIWQEMKNSAARPAAPTTATTHPPSLPGRTPKPNPDQIEHPMDNMKVPKYPLNNMDLYEKRSDHHEMYLCRHDKNTGKDCCTKGFTRKQMKQLIRKDISAWKANVERLVFKDQVLDSRHKTWYTFNDLKLRDVQKKDEEKEREKKEEEEAREHQRIFQEDEAEQIEQQRMAADILSAREEE